jgi:hypothetical protein
MSSATKIFLSNGTSRKYFWQVAGAAPLGTTSHLEGTHWVKPLLLNKLE